jgi:hypothetical protein
MDSSAILARLEVVEDRQQIYEVLTRYCRALDRCDLELMKSVYWEDGYDNHGVFQGNAQDYAAFIIPEIQQWFEMTMHAICNVHIELDGHRAHVESVFDLVLPGQGRPRTYRGRLRVQLSARDGGRG